MTLIIDQRTDTEQEAVTNRLLPVLPVLSPTFGSSPHIDTGGRAERGREEGEGGETGSEEEDEEGEDGEEGEVSIGAGPLE